MEELLSQEQIDTHLAQIDVAWSAIPGQGLVREFATQNFAQGVALVNKVAEIAERLNHHPDVRLTYNQVELTVTTHSASGLTLRDFELARAIDGGEFTGSSVDFQR